MTPEQAFGQVIREWRLRLGLSQEQVGFESGYHRTYVSLLERGQKSPSLGALFRLSEALCAKPSDIVVAVEARVACAAVRGRLAGERGK
jgi:transcriptional regulator with XRE-family HTH domain